jgi:hypothetical protein
MAGEAIKNIGVILFQSVILNHFKSDNYFFVGVMLTFSPSRMGIEVMTALISKFGGKFFGLVE